MINSKVSIHKLLFIFYLFRFRLYGNNQVGAVDYTEFAPVTQVSLCNFRRIHSLFGENAGFFVDILGAHVNAQPTAVNTLAAIFFYIYGMVHFLFLFRRIRQINVNT